MIKRKYFYDINELPKQLINVRIVSPREIIKILREENRKLRIENNELKKEIERRISNDNITN